MTAGAHILIVDDDPDFADALRTMLTGAGYEVTVAYDGRAGVAAARRARPDAILVDVMMEERTAGFFTVQELRRAPETARTPIVVISALYAQVEEFQVPPDPRWAGHDAFLPKPVDSDLLLARLATLLTRPAPVPGAPEE